MKYKTIKKPFVTGIIVLLIGIAVSPIINASTQLSRLTYIDVNKKVLPNNELLDLTVSYCKFDDIKNFTVQITGQQFDKLNSLINEFKLDLDSAKTLEETIVLYNEMLNSLLELGLLPDNSDFYEIK